MKLFTPQQSSQLYSFITSHNYYRLLGTLLALRLKLRHNCYKVVRQNATLEHGNGGITSNFDVMPANASGSLWQRHRLKQQNRTIYNSILAAPSAIILTPREMMQKKILNIKAMAIFFLISVWLPPAFAADDQTDAVDLAATFDYKIHPGDILSISVWREEDLRSEVLIRPDGKFSFPLAGDINANGKSVEQIRELLVERLSRYIPDLVVSVSVLAINGNKVYVIGQVNRPGEISVNPNIDVMQALSIAGGANPFAQLNDISILRRTENGLISIPFRYGDIEKGKRLEQNIILQAGDVVVVP